MIGGWDMAFIEDKSFVLQKHLPRGFETGKLKSWNKTYTRTWIVISYIATSNHSAIDYTKDD